MRHHLFLSSLLLAFALSGVACTGDPEGGTLDPDAAPDDPQPDAAPPIQGEGLEACAAGGTSLQIAWTADNQHGEVLSMAVDPSGKVVLGSIDRSVKVWTFGFGGASPLEPPTYGTPFTAGPGVTRSLAFDASSQWLIGGDDSGTVSVWFVGEGDLRDSRDLGDAPLAAADMTFGEQILVADTSFGGALRVWSVGDDSLGPVLATDLWNVSDILDHAPTYSVYVAGHIYGAPAIERRLDADPSQLIELWQDQQFSSQVTRIAMLPDGLHLVAVANEMVAVFDGTDLASGPLAITRVEGHQPIAVAVTPSGQWFFTLGAEGTVRAFRTDTAAPTLSIDVAPSVGIGIDATGELLLLGGADGLLRGLRCP